MDKDRSGGLVVVDVQWEQRPGNGWLLREVFDLLLRDPALVRLGAGPDLTDRDTPPTMLVEGVTGKGGGER